MVYCTPEHRFGSDALLLARFCEPKRSQKAADLCSGCGIVALEWHDRGHRGPCMGLELRKKLRREIEGRCLLHGRYIICYEIDEAISILRVLDTRTDYVRALFGEGNG